MSGDADPARADDFQGDDAHLIDCIDALLDLDDAKALVPHGLGGRGSHAYRLLCAARRRLATLRQSQADRVAVGESEARAVMNPKSGSLAARSSGHLYNTTPQPPTAAPDAEMDIHALASAIHDARFDQGPASSHWGPFDQESESGKIYCTRIANAVQMHILSTRPTDASRIAAEVTERCAQVADEVAQSLGSDLHSLPPTHPDYHLVYTCRHIARAIAKALRATLPKEG